MPRPIHIIAMDIVRTWHPVNLYASPYLTAMLQIKLIKDDYGADDARGIVLYFLSNATTWRGSDARRIKAELRALL